MQLCFLEFITAAHIIALLLPLLASPSPTACGILLRSLWRSAASVGVCSVRSRVFPCHFQSRRSFPLPAVLRATIVNR